MYAHGDVLPKQHAERSSRSKYASVRYSTVPAGPDSDSAQAYDLPDLNSAPVELWFDLRRRGRLRLRFQPPSERLARSSDPIQMEIYVRRFFMHKTRKRCKSVASGELGGSPVRLAGAFRFLRPLASGCGGGRARIRAGNLEICFTQKNI